MSFDHKPSIGATIRFSDGYEAKVTEYTERGFICRGEPGHLSIPKLDICSTGEQEIFTDTPEYRLGLWGFAVVS